MLTFCFFSLAVIFFIIGVVQLLTPTRTAAQTAPGFTGGAPQPADRSVLTRSAPLNLANASPAAPAGKPGGGLQKLGWIGVGQRVYVSHPVQGERLAHVLGRILFSELWQRQRDPQSPWVPTGSQFAGFWLEGDLFLLNWQNRFYLLDEATELSDGEIQRDFLPHARKYAQSDQTADVYFAYPPAMWHIDDIGKFQVAEIQGNGLRYQVGGIGRFIHSSGDSQRALVVEDFEGSSGQDTARSGYQIEEGDIRKEE